MSDSIRLI